MENPYAAHDLTPELVQEERRRPKFWYGLLIAYVIHHVFSVLGMFTGVALKPSEWRRFFSTDNALAGLFSVVSIPLADLFMVLEPPIMWFYFPELTTIWHLLRIPLVLAIPVAGFMYAKSRRPDWLWYLAIVSFGVYVSFVLWFDPRTMGR